MAVTRINNNQITDATTGNANFGINAAAKVQSYSVSGTKLANNLTYGSDLTITGNLTVQGNTTAIDTTYTTIEDPVILLASTQTGAPSVDIGFIGERGTSDNIAFVWDESAGEFITAFTTSTETNTTVTVSSYASLKTLNTTVTGNLSTAGFATVTGNITGGNVNSNAQVVATGNITGGNLNTAGQVVATGNVTGGNVITAGLVSATGNIVSSANINGANLNASANIVSVGAVVTGNITGGNVLTAGNVTGGNLNTSGQVVATGNITGGNLITAGTFQAASISATGNISGGNLISAANVNAVGGYFTGNVTVLGNLNATIGVVYANSGIFYGNTVTGNSAIFAGLPGFTALGTNVVAQFAGNANSYSQINFENISNGTSASTDYIATADNGTDTTYYLDMGINSSNFNDQINYPGFGPNDSYVHNHGGNLILNPESSGKTIKLMVGGTANNNVVGNVSSTGFDITGVVTATGNVSGSNLTTSGQVTATGNVTGGNVSTAGQVVATGNITGGNLITSGSFQAASISATGNITGGNIITSGAVNAATLNTTGNAVIAGNLFVLGNITYNNVNDLRIEDPVIILGTGPNGAPLTTPDSYDRGTFMEYYTSARGNAWMGWQNSSGNMIAAANVSFSGNDIIQVNAYGTFQAGNIYSQSTVSTGNITGGNLITAGLASVTGNITGGNVSTAGQVTATGNITGGNLITAGLGSFGTTVTATGNITGGNVSTAGQVTATGNITGGNLNTAGLGSFGTTVTATGNITGGNLITAGLASVTGNVTGGNLNTAGQVTATGNITGGNLITTGQVTATGNITGGNLAITGAGTFGTTLGVTGNITGGNANIIGTTASTSKTTGALKVAGGVGVAGDIYAGNSVVVDSGAYGNVTTTQFASVFGSGSGPNPYSVMQVRASDNVSGIGMQAYTGSGTLYGNTAINFVTGATIRDRDVYSGGTVRAVLDSTGLTVTGIANISGNITGANVTTAGAGTFGNITISGSNVDSTAGRITFNQLDADVDFAIDGDTVANVFYVDAGTGTTSFGSSTQTTNAIIAMNATNSFLMPVGNTAQRPGTGVTGMLRFNSTTNGVEVYNASEWATVGTPSFTVISDQQFNGDGSNVAFTLSAAATTNSTIVSINGIVQIPTIAYSVGGVGANVLTFTEAPQTGDLIDVRAITTTTEIVAISNSPGTGIVQPNATLGQVDITGNLLPVSNNVQSLGSASLRWKDLYVSGNTITMGNVVMKNVAGGNTIGFYGPDGTTPATIASTSIDTTTIANGTSNVSVASSGGNVRFNVAGTSNVMVVSSSVVAITGDLSVTGNATLSGNILGDRVQNGTTSIDIQTASGNANVTVGGTSNVVVWATTGEYVTGLISATGNITGGNISTAGNLSAPTAAADTNTTQVATTAFVIAQASSTTPAVIGATGAVGTSLKYARADHVHEGVTSVTASTGISTSAADGAITLTNTGVTSAVAGTGVSVSAGTGAVTFSIGQSVATSATPSFAGLTNSGANGVGNIGAVGGYFNTVFAKATSAQYADLAENYVADAEYAPGTVLSFGGENEVTVSKLEGDRKIAGVVSTNPSYIMNSVLEADHVATVALTGRVPTFVSGPVEKGDMMVSAGNGRAIACATPVLGTVIGKALENHPGGDGVIEVVVGRL